MIGYCFRDFFLIQASLDLSYFILFQVTGNTVSSILALFGCILGLFVCVVFAVGPCDSDKWFSKCSFRLNKTEHRVLAILITIFLSSCTILSVYSSLMSCIHGWVFDFGACAVQTRNRKQNGDEHTGSRPTSTFQPLPMFDIEENCHTGDDAPISNNYNATSSFRQVDHDGNHLYGSSNDEDYHGHARKHVTGQQPPSYVAVLNDPAMKKKLKERSRLQEH